jgi:hypothetical protein
MTVREERKRTDLSVSTDLTQFQEALEEAGITRETANTWQKVARVPEDKFEAYFPETAYF